MKKLVLFGLVAAMLPVVVACTGMLEPQGEKQMPGIILYTSNADGGGLMDENGAAIGFAQALDAPDTVQAGEPFDVTITTTGDGCWKRGYMEVNAGGALAELRPYDVYTGSEICTMIAQFFQYKADLTFETSGEAIIRVFGRKVTDGNLLGGEEITIEHTIVVK